MNRKANFSIVENLKSDRFRRIELHRYYYDFKHRLERNNIM